MARIWTILGTHIVFGVLAAHSAVAQEPSPKPATPMEPVQAIVDAFRTHQVVALADGVQHGDEQSHRFRLKLIRDPRFATAVDDIVIELGNSLYQSTADRYVNGENVPDAELERIWQDTSQVVPMVDAAISRELFDTVREVNATLRVRDRVRILLADPPLDWSKVKSKSDVEAVTNGRDHKAADMIQREVLAKKRHALLVYGGMHLQRRNLFYNYENDSEWVVARLENRMGIKVFTIWVAADLDKVLPESGNWPVPSLARVRGTLLGAADFSVYYPYEVRRVTLQDGQWVPIPKEEWRNLRMEEQVDAVMHMGPRSAITIADVPLKKCQDPAHIEMRSSRLALMSMSGAADRMKQHCAALIEKSTAAAQ